MKSTVSILYNLVFICSAVQVMAKGLPLSVDDIKSRLKIRGEIFLLSADGKRVLEKGAVYTWRRRVVNGKSEVEAGFGDFDFGGTNLYFFSRWTVQDDGSIRVLLEEYDSAPKGKNSDSPVSRKLVKREERALLNLEQIDWISPKSDATRRIVAHFTPEISYRLDPKPITDLPIAGRNIMITDNVGNLWADGMGVLGKYVGFTTPKGSLIVSYYPFKGASGMGEADGNRIELTLEGKKVVTITSQTLLIPDGMRTIVYGLYRPDKRTPSKGVHVFGEEKQLVKWLDEGEM